MNISKPAARCLITVLITGFLFGCSPKTSSVSDTMPPNDTRLGASRAFVEAVIKGDRAAISKLDRSDTWSSNQVIKVVTPDFSHYQSDDFSIVAANFSEGNVVYVQTKDERIKTAIIVDQLEDGKYYFMDFVSTRMPQLSY